MERFEIFGWSKLFGSTKQKLDLPPNFVCNSHRPNKVDYSIPCPNTQATRQHIEESSNVVEHGVAHTTSILEMDCTASQWHIARLTTNSTKQCCTIHANTCILCNAKVGTCTHGTLASTYKGLKKEFRFIKNVECEFWFCPNDIKRCESGNEKKNILDWFIVPNTWLVKNKYKTLEGGGDNSLRMPVSNCSKGGHFHHIGGYWQSPRSPFFGCIFACLQTLMPIQLPNLGRQCVKCNNIHHKSQKQMGECRNNGRKLCS